MYWFSILLFILCIVFPLFHIIRASFGVKKKPEYMSKIATSEKGMSILIPCYNEESILQTTIQGMSSLKYTNYEIIFINDVFTDQTMEILIDLLSLEIDKDEVDKIEGLSYMPIKGVYKSSEFPQVLVIDKMNGGKADSLNAGIAYSTKEIVITLDADSILEEQALPILNRAFMDSKVIAAGGNVHVLQGRKIDANNEFVSGLGNMKQIVRFQILEYLRGFYILKASLAKSNALSIISGAFGAFDRKVLLEIGGYRNTIGEDIDITLRIQQYISKHKGLKVLFIPESICYTEVPESWRDLYKQRIRWQKAFMDCLVKYAGLFFRTIFTNRVSFFFIMDSFITGIMASFFTFYYMIVLILLFFDIPLKGYIVFLGLSLVVNLLYTVASLKIAHDYGHRYAKKDYFNIVITVILEYLVYRFITLFIILIGSIAYFVKKDGWNKVERTGREYTIEKASKSIV